MSIGMSSQYELIGNRIAQNLKNTPQDRTILRNQLTSFLDKYSKAPLFIVGIDDVIYRDWLANPREETIADFRLPFPTIVLDFPGGLLQKSANPRMDDSMIIFVDTVKKNTYLFEGIRTAEAADKIQKKASINEREIIESNGLTRADSGVGEAFSFLVEMFPEENSFIANYSCEFINDCQIPVEQIPGISSYAVFSRCVPTDGNCAIKTPMCRMIDGITNFAVVFIMMVIDYINRQDRFTVKVTPEQTDREKRLAQKGKKLSFAKKPAHIVLDHSQVREIIAASSQGGSHASPLPHQRRGHWRLLQADCFKEKKKVWVRPADINKGMTLKIQRNIYEVVS